MKRASVALLLVAAAAAAGLTCSELLFRWVSAREFMARIVGRGELVAVVDGAGIYEKDGDAEQLIIDTNLRRESRDQQITRDEVERELELFRHQFGDAKIFDAELEASGLSSDALRERIADHLRARRWIEHQIASGLAVTEQESRAFYEAKRAAFAQPPRFRASHLFLAAPGATPPEVVQEKAAAIKSFSKRLAKGENFGKLVAELSEDEATKDGGGDLGFFSESRMPAGLIAEIQKQSPGKASAPVQSALGFHIFQLTDTRPPRQMEFEEVAGEIALHLANAKRASAVERLREGLAAAEFIRTPL